MKDKPLKTIKWGIIGLGKIADKFATDLVDMDNTELYAVASRSKENAAKFAEKFNVKKAYGSYEELAKDVEIDAVYIATPHSFHKEHAILCLKNKKAVLCEKPFAINLHEVTEMIAVAKQHNVLLMEALWTYFLPHYEQVLKIIKNNSLGKVIKMEADFGFHTPYSIESRLFKKEVGGGSLLDIGIYPIFTALSSLGVPENIEASATFFENGADSSCDMVFHYKDAKAILKSTLLEETKTEAIFTCTNGTLKINKRFHEPTNVTVVQNGKEDSWQFIVSSFGYVYEIEHFNKLLRKGKTESDVMTYDFSKNLIKTLDKVREIIGLEY
jgi:predicted dehydrogenase